MVAHEANVFCIIEHREHSSNDINMEASGLCVPRFASSIVQTKARCKASCTVCSKMPMHSIQCYVNAGDRNIYV